MTTYGEIKSGEMAAPVAIAKEITALPALVKAAAAKLASAATAAEVLDAQDAASLAYDASKRAARVAKAKKAHDELIAAAHRAQADALEIEAQAKRRLADEYDGGQERGEIQKPGGDRKTIVPVQNNDPAKVEEIGLTRKQVHESRRVRNAESAQPGVVRAALDQAIAEGKEPTRAVVNEAVSAALGETKRVDTRTEAQRDAEAIQSAWDHAGEPARALFLMANNLQFQAKASEDNGRTSAAMCAPMAGEVSRPVVGRSATATSEGMDVTGGESAATNSSVESRERQKASLDLVSKPEATPVDGARKGPSGTAAKNPKSPATHPVPNGVQAGRAPEVAPPASGATPFDNPRCLKPETCHFAHSRDCCFDCSLAWAHRPRDEQIRLWAEANEAAA